MGASWLTGGRGEERERERERERGGKGGSRDRASANEKAASSSNGHNVWENVKLIRWIRIDPLMPSRASIPRFKWGGAVGGRWEAQGGFYGRHRHRN